MKVKILKAEKDSYWYADKIGQEFKVTEWFDKEKFAVKDEVLRLISKSDCEIVPKKSKLKDENLGLKIVNQSFREEIKELKLVNQTHLEKLQEVKNQEIERKKLDFEYNFKQLEELLKIMGSHDLILIEATQNTSRTYRSKTYQFSIQIP